MLLACSPKKTVSLILAEVNGEKITLHDYEKALQVQQWKFGSEINFGPERLKTFKKEVLDSLLKERLLLQEAARRGITVSEAELEKNIAQFRKHYSQKEDFEKLLEQMGDSLGEFKVQREKELKIKKLVDLVTQEQIHISEEELKKSYEENARGFHHSEQVHARQLVTDSREKADALRAMIMEGAPFEEVAKKYSLSPDRKDGGDLGWFGRGTMPPEFDRICFVMRSGEISPVVKTPYGYHIFQVLEHREAGQLPFDEVRESLRRRLMQSKGEGVFQKWYELLNAQAKIEVRAELLEEKKQ